MAEGAKAKAMPRWHLMYFVLAGFDLVTVALGLWLSAHLLANYEASVAANQAWAGRISAITELSGLAQATNAPGNDVFDSQDAPQERRRRDIALADFEARLDAIVGDFQAAVPAGQRRAVVAALGETRAAMNRMVEESETIFVHFERGNAAAAGRRMATMDRTYGDLTSSISTAINAA